MTKLNNSKCDQTQIVTKLKNSNCDKPSLKLWQNLYYDKSQFMSRTTNLYGSFNKNILTPWLPMRCSLGSVLRFSQILVWYHNLKIPFIPDLTFVNEYGASSHYLRASSTLWNVPPIIDETKFPNILNIDKKIKEIMILKYWLW